MKRKSLALVVILLIAGLSPASAIIGFCTRMSCCSHASEAPAAFSTERNDCCATIACYESPSLKLTASSSQADPLSAGPALITLAPEPLPAPFVTRDFADTSPPVPARLRLASLSTLLI